MMFDIVQFEKDHTDLIDKIKNLEKEERDILLGCIRNYENDIRPRYSCKRGDVVSFWSTWSDLNNHVYLERLERCAIALQDCDNVSDSVMLEYCVNAKGGCWRYSRVDAEKFIGVIGHVDLSEWEAYTEKLWEAVKHGKS